MKDVMLPVPPIIIFFLYDASQLCRISPQKELTAFEVAYFRANSKKSSRFFC